MWAFGFIADGFYLINEFLRDFFDGQLQGDGIRHFGANAFQVAHFVDFELELVRAIPPLLVDSLDIDGESCFQQMLEFLIIFAE
jgi:hypothetical protein